MAHLACVLSAQASLVHDAAESLLQALDELLVLAARALAKRPVLVRAWAALDHMLDAVLVKNGYAGALHHGVRVALVGEGGVCEKACFEGRGGEGGWKSG